MSKFKTAIALFLISVMTGTMYVATLAKPNTDAKSAILMEATAGTVVLESNADERLPMASTTKIMTALVAIEKGELDSQIKIPDTAIGVEGSSVYLKSGEVLTLRQLLYAVLLESANDAAEAVAISIAGSVEDFAVLMNEKASDLGLTNTHFTNPHGLDAEGHYTTARELAKIACEALKNQTFKEIVSTYKTTIPGTEYDRLLVNHNRLLTTYEGAVGVKTGFTKHCGRCLVSAAERDGITLVAVTLSDPNDWKDHKELLDYGFSVLECVEICGDEGVSFNIPVSGSDSEYVRAAALGKQSVVLPKGSRLSMTLCPRRFLWAPVNKGDYVGKAVYTIDGKEVLTLDLYAQTDCCEEAARNSFISNLFSKEKH